MRRPDEPLPTSHLVDPASARADESEKAVTGHHDRLVAPRVRPSIGDREAGSAVAFDFKAFEKVLLTDNKKYERVKKSDLHDLVELLASGSPKASAVEKEMKKVKADKWKKYGRTRSYLLQAFPELSPKLVNFKTKSLTKGSAGAIVHVLTWESDSGDLDDLSHALVREYVSWKAPAKEVQPFVDKDYAKSGKHYGVGNAATTPGNTGQGDDTHAALGPFTPNVLEFDGPGTLVFEMDQVYQVSMDGGKSWDDIPGSEYTLTREVARKGDKTELTITKSGKGGELTNSTTV